MINRKNSLKPEFDRLADALREISGERPIIYVLNPGNWGDALIRDGTERFFLVYGFQYLRVHHKDIYKNRKSIRDLKLAIGHVDPVLVYNGCGLYNDQYGIVSKIASLTHEFSASVLFPSTVAIDMARQNFSDTTKLFVRDRFESAANAPLATFCHDLAFFVDVPNFSDGSGVGYFFRRDREAVAGRTIPLRNRDISARGKTHHNVKPFLKRIAKFQVIHTDRLHVGIAGAMLGRQVHLYANNYYKIEAIYRSSIQPNFENVRFHKEPLKIAAKGRFFWRRTS